MAVDTSYCLVLRLVESGREVSGPIYRTFQSAIERYELHGKFINLCSSARVLKLCS